MCAAAAQSSTDNDDTDDLMKRLEDAKENGFEEKNQKRVNKEDANKKTEKAVLRKLVADFPFVGPKPLFSEIIAAQTPDGNWMQQSLELFKNIVAAAVIQDANVIEALDAAQLDTSKQEYATLYVTLLAIYILQNAYKDEADEAVMIIANAKAFCKLAGIRNPGTVIKKFELSLR